MRVFFYNDRKDGATLVERQFAALQVVSYARRDTLGFLTAHALRTGGLCLDELQIARNALQRLARLNPGNAERQRDTSVSHNEIGDVLQRQGDLPGALGAFRQGMTITEYLAGLDPGNAGWQRDLSFSLIQRGDLLDQQDDDAETSNTYGKGSVIGERPTKLDPNHAESQYDLFVCLLEVTRLLVRSESGTNATPARRLVAQAELLATRFSQGRYRDRDLRATADLLAQALAL